MAYPRRRNDIDLSMGTVPNFGWPGENLSINAMLTCTYNESHIVSGGRYHRHLLKCQEKYFEKHGDSLTKETGKMVICPLNNTHHVHSSVLQLHITICPDFYKWHMENQPEPPSMIVSYPRYDLTMDKKHEEAVTPTFPCDKFTKDWLELLSGESTQSGLEKILEELPVASESRLLETADFAEQQSSFVGNAPEKPLSVKSVSQYSSSAYSYKSTTRSTPSEAESNQSCVCPDSDSNSDN